MSFGGDITVTSVLVNSPTSATVNISVSPSASLGAHTVTATTLGEVATLSNGFTVTAGLPTISTVSPTTGRQAETLSLGIVGQFTHFAAGSTTANLGAGVTVNSVSVSDATHATVNVTVAPGASPGSRTVVLTTGAETAQQVGGFTVTPGQPTLFSISPVSAIQGTNATVILNGAFTNFSPGLTTVSFGAGISVGTVTVNGPTLASVPISIAAGATVGARSVSITTGTESRDAPQRVHGPPGRPDNYEHRSERRSARPDPKRNDHGRVHQLAGGCHVGQLRRWDHGQLERRRLNDNADDQHHYRRQRDARPA